MSKIFISYRRDDSSGEAGRIFDQLSRRLRRTTIFMDVDAIELGSDFVETLKNNVEECDVMLAIIGPTWLSLLDEDGLPRIQNEADFVRIEIATALERGIRVVPLLVRGAELPSIEELPDNIRELARRHGVELRHDRFNSDIEHLTASIPISSPKSTNRKLGWVMGASAMVLLATTVYISRNFEWLPWESSTKLVKLDMNRSLKVAKRTVRRVVVQEENQLTGEIGEIYLSGFFITSSGYMITSAYPFAKSKEKRVVSIQIGTAESHAARFVLNKAEIVSVDMRSNIAVLKSVRPNKTPYLPVCASYRPKAGEKLIAIGVPHGTRLLTAFSSFLTVADANRWITDGIFGPGTEGGPVLNEQGQAVAIITGALANSFGEPLAPLKRFGYTLSRVGVVEACNT